MDLQQTFLLFIIALVGIGLLIMANALTGLGLRILQHLRHIVRNTNIVADAIEEKDERRTVKWRIRASRKLGKVLGEAMLADEAEATPAPVPAYRQPAPHGPTQKFRTYPLNQGETAFVADLLTDLIDRTSDAEPNSEAQTHRECARPMRDHMRAALASWAAPEEAVPQRDSYSYAPEHPRSQAAL